MRALGYTASISNEGLSFPAVAFFDSYFNILSKNRYRVIEPCTVNGIQGYLVEEYEAKYNILLTALKVISFMTVIIPLIMGVGKLIARNRYHFFIANEGSAGSKVRAALKREGTASIEDSKKRSPGTLSPIETGPKVLPEPEQQKQERAASIENFKNKAIKTLFSPQKKGPHLEFSIGYEQQELLERANQNKYNPAFIPTGVSTIRGGRNFVFFLDRVLGFVFKPVETKEEGEKYIELSQTAHEIIARNVLHLIYVPESKLIEIQGSYFIMQEKADLIFSSYAEQKGVYAYCWNDEKMQDYIKAVFSQLLTFISKMKGFADVKYDNIPLTTDGKVALIDLDESSRSCITGLTAGCANRKDGLFNYIPHEHLKEFLALARSALNADDYQSLTKKMKDIEQRAEKKRNAERNYLEFSKTNRIFSPTQNINPALPNLFEPRKQQLAQSVIETINQKLSDSKSFSIKTGRTLTLNTNVQGPLAKKAREIWGSSLPNLSGDPKVISFNTILVEILEKLKTAGYICKYKPSPHYPSVKVVC